MAACSFSSSRLWARTAARLSSSVAATRWSYQSIASSSSISDTIARWRLIRAGFSESSGSWSPALLTLPSVRLLLSGFRRGSRYRGGGVVGSPTYPTAACPFAGVRSVAASRGGAQLEDPRPGHAVWFEKR